MFVLGMCSLLAGIIILFLPETLGNILIEDINEVKNLKRDGKPFFSFWSENTLNDHMETLLNRKKENSQAVGIRIDST